MNKNWFQIFKKKRIIIALVFVVLVSLLGLTTSETQANKILVIEEEAVFDPICKGENGEEFDGKLFCEKWSWIVPMGGSANVFIGNENDNHARVQFLKININEIPNSNLLTTTIISKSELLIKIRYEPALTNSTEEIPFYLITKMCENNNWSSNTHSKNLPCINENLFPIGNYSSFDPINPKWIEDIKIDLKPHIELAKEKGLNSFTELIQFYPVEISNNNGYDNDTRICVEEKMDEYFTYSDFNECLLKYRISVYSSTNPNEGARPQILLEYSTKPTLLTQALIAASVAGIPIVSTVLQMQYRSKEEQKSKMTRICDSLEKEVHDTLIGLRDGIRNTKPIKKISIEFDSDYEAIELTLDKPITRVILFTDAYTGILNSGSFENFDKDHQIEISTLYNEINEYNKTLDLYYKNIENSRLMVKSDDVIVRFQNNLIMNLKFYLNRLGGLRFSIIKRIGSERKGILKILNDEKEKFQ